VVLVVNQAVGVLEVVLEEQVGLVVLGLLVVLEELTEQVMVQVVEEEM
jgi:hypothetical protein